MTNQEFQFGNHTDVGQVRAKNEDYLGYFQTGNGHVFVVCDGMGGHVGGAVASQTAVNSIKDFFNQQYFHDLNQAILEAIQYANQQIFQESQNRPELWGMGTTCVVLVIRRGKIHYGHVGDSRLYKLSRGKMERITKDHSYVQTLVDDGIITDAQAEVHPRKNELIRALGTQPSVEVDVSLLALDAYKGDTYLLCTDGLNGLISDDKIAEVLRENLGIQHRAIKLVQMANTAGGYDNITVQIIEFLQGADAPFQDAQSNFQTQDKANLLGKTNPLGNANLPLKTPEKKPDLTSKTPPTSQTEKKKNKPKVEKEEFVSKQNYSSKRTGFKLPKFRFKIWLPAPIKWIFKSLLSRVISAIVLVGLLYLLWIFQIKPYFDEVKETAKQKIENFDKWKDEKFKSITNPLKKGKQKLKDLAQKYKVKVKDFLEANGVSSPEELEKLDTIKIPKAIDENLKKIEEELDIKDTTTISE